MSTGTRWSASSSACRRRLPRSTSSSSAGTASVAASGSGQGCWVWTAIAVGWWGLSPVGRRPRSQPTIPTPTLTPTELPGTERSTGSSKSASTHTRGRTWEPASVGPGCTGSRNWRGPQDGGDRRGRRLPERRVQELRQGRRVVVRRPLGRLRGLLRESRSPAFRSVRSDRWYMGQRCAGCSTTADNAVRRNSCADSIEELWEWSPVGARLAYARVDGETDELFVVDPSDGHRTSLGTADGDLTALDWSPDGTRIAYADGGSVYTVEVDGGERSLLADSFVDIIDIAWSPGGTQDLVHDQTRYRMQVMNADGSDLHLLLEGEDACCETEWSPDGDRTSYQLSFENGRPVLRLRGLDGLAGRLEPDQGLRLGWLRHGCDMGAMLSRSGPPTERRSPTTPAASGWSRTPTERVRLNASTGSCTEAGLAAGSPDGTCSDGEMGLPFQA